MLTKLKLKYIQSLGQKKYRDETGLFVAEGPKLVKELLDSGTAKVQEIYALQDWINEQEQRLSGSQVTIVTETELERLSQLTTPNKVLAIVQQFAFQPAGDEKTGIILALDSIRDPGNLGTIIRIADWFGVEQVVCSEDSAELYNPKVIQSTMGSIARVHVFYTNLFAWLEEKEGSDIYATAMDGEDITAIKKIKNGIIIIGNESRGISPSFLDKAKIKITIPRKGKAESLNAAVATGIVLSHIV